MIGHLKRRSHERHFVVKEPFVHNEAFVICACPEKEDSKLLKSIPYYTLSDRLPETKEKRKQRMLLERNGTTFEFPPHRSSLGPLHLPRQLL